MPCLLALQSHVVIDAMPGKDRWDIFSIWLTFALVIIGAFTFGVVFYQARKSKEATQAAKIAADAARKSAEAYVNSERAWIMVELEPRPGDGANPSVLHNQSVVGVKHTISTQVLLRVVCRNEGRSPAWITEKRICLKVVNEIPTTPDLEHTEIPNDDLDSVSVGKAAPPWDVTLTCEGRAVERQELIVYGVIKYRDAFSDSHYTTFGYRFEMHNSLRRIGLPKYNESM